MFIISKPIQYIYTLLLIKLRSGFTGGTLISDSWLLENLNFQMVGKFILGMRERFKGNSKTVADIFVETVI